MDASTCFGKFGRAPSRLIAEVGAIKIGLATSEDHYYMLLYQGGEDEFDPEDLICVGVALGRGFQNTQELRPDKEKWKESVLKNLIEWRRIKF
jgi:hypothetical protein